MTKNRDQVRVLYIFVCLFLFYFLNKSALDVFAIDEAEKAYWGPATGQPSETEIALTKYTGNAEDVIIPNAADFGEGITKVWITKEMGSILGGSGCSSLYISETGEGDRRKVFMKDSSCSNCFKDQTGIRCLYLGGLDVSNVTDMRDMFMGCQKITSLSGLENWNVSVVGRMDYMFHSCTGLTFMDLSI